MKFEEIKTKTIADLESVKRLLDEVIECVKIGDIDSFEDFWWGDEENDASISKIREIMLLRHAHRMENKE